MLKLPLKFYRLKEVHINHKILYYFIIRILSVIIDSRQT